MVPRNRFLAALACGLPTIVVGVASADDYYPTDPGVAPPRSESLWRDPSVASGVGIGVDVGGGVTGFVGSRLRSTTSSFGGAWSVRAAFGTHIPLALEVGYTGSATAINGQLGPETATLMGRTLESAIRYTVMPRARWSPYAFAGLGWQHYTINDRSFELSDTGIRTSDDLLVMPFGLGMGYRVGAIVTDLRGTLRAARGANLVLDNAEVALATGQGSYAPMHSWETSLNVGYEF
ncbi:MAG TPA: outer membrane beta-barrel protein [Kofleriaceae bacterium]|nr:outer membrane beta-barrel protein [Kofleriaceae bacterium]